MLSLETKQILSQNNTVYHFLSRSTDFVAFNSQILRLSHLKIKRSIRPYCSTATECCVSTVQSVTRVFRNFVLSFRAVRTMQN